MTAAEASAIAPLSQDFRPGLAERLGVSFAAALIIALTIMMAGFAAFVAPSNAVLAIVLGGFAAVIASMAAITAREAVSRWRLRATISGDRLTGFLPRRRGFNAAAREDVSVALSDIARIETREECFSSLGVTTTQRAYQLVMKDGAAGQARLFLGADRQMLPAHFARIVGAIVSRTGADVADLGMVDGDPGFLLVAGQKAPDWPSPPLSPAEAVRRRADGKRTQRLLIAAAFIVIVARLVSGG